MRPLPAPSEYGTWDTLPAEPPDADLDLTSSDVKDGLRRRDLLTQQWYAYRHYPHGFWSEDACRRNPEQGEAWRNWFLRRSWEGLSYINGCLLLWSR